MLVAHSSVPWYPPNNYSHVRSIFGEHVILQLPEVISVVHQYIWKKFIGISASVSTNGFHPVSSFAERRWQTCATYRRRCEAFPTEFILTRLAAFHPLPGRTHKRKWTSRSRYVVSDKWKKEFRLARNFTQFQLTTFFYIFIEAKCISLEISIIRRNYIPFLSRYIYENSHNYWLSIIWYNFSSG